MGQGPGDKEHGKAKVLSAFFGLVFTFLSSHSGDQSENLEQRRLTIGGGESG